jgi:hypothetical protein
LVPTMYSTGIFPSPTDIVSMCLIFSLRVSMSLGHPQVPVGLSMGNPQVK